MNAETNIAQNPFSEDKLAQEILLFGIRNSQLPTAYVRYPIYHYTSVQGLTGILRGDHKVRLWFSRYDCLNDKSEGEYIIEVFKYVCDSLLSSGQITDQFYRCIYNIDENMKRLFAFGYEDNGREIHISNIRKLPYQTYLCCFSLNGDSMPMWNYYVKGNKYEGYNLGFSSDIYNVQTLMQGTGIEMKLCPVIYSTEEQMQIIQKAILELYQYSDLDERNGYKRIRGALVSFFTDWKMVFKNACFSHEEEVRMILYVPTLSDQEKLLVPNGFSNLHFRIAHGILIPYLELEADARSLFQITVGPLVEHELARKTLQLYLKEKGYSDIAVMRSHIPVRY